MFGLGRQPDKVIKRNTARREQDIVEKSTVESSNSSSNSNVDKELAQKRYEHAKDIWQQTRDPEHWQYMQRCLDKL